jgi:hypothetical protein
VRDPVDLPSGVFSFGCGYNEAMEFLRALNPSQADALTTVVMLAAAIVAGLVVHRILYRLLRRWAERGSNVLTAVVSRTGRPAAYIIPLALIGIILTDCVWKRLAETRSV